MKTDHAEFVVCGDMELIELWCKLLDEIEHFFLFGEDTSKEPRKYSCLLVRVILRYCHTIVTNLTQKEDN